MAFGLLDWVVFIAVPIIAWIIGRYKRQAGSWRGYFLATGNLSSTGVAATYFGANLTFTAIFLILAEIAYNRGAWVFAIPVCWILGTIVFIYYYDKIKPYIKNGLTLHQVLGEAFNSPALQRWASVCTIVAFVGTVGLEFYGGIKLLQWIGLTPLADISIAFLLAFIVSAFTVTGGFRGVAIADIWLDIVTAIGTLLIFYYVLMKFNIFTQPHLSAVSASIVPTFSTWNNIFFVLGAIFIFLPFQFCTLDSWQRLGAWEKRDKTPTKLLLGSGVLLALAYCAPIFVGLAVRQQGLSIPAGSHPLKIFLDSLHLAPPIMGIIFAGFISAMFSTADELLNCCSLSLLFDTFQILRTNQQRTQYEEAKLVRSGQFYTAFFGFIAAVIAFLALLFERKITDLSIAVFSTQVIFTIPLIVALRWRSIAPRLAEVAIRTMWVSFIVSMLMVSIGWAKDDRQIADAAPAVAFFFAIVFFGVLALLQRRKVKDEPA